MKNFFNDKREQKQESREFWRELKNQEMDEAAKNEQERADALQRSCPTCYMIRSPFEVLVGSCDRGVLKRWTLAHKCDTVEHGNNERRLQ